MTKQSIDDTQSLNTGIFPNKFKQAKIIPIHKKEDVHLIENYRPISLLPSVSKIFEKVVLIKFQPTFMKIIIYHKINMDSENTILQNMQFLN